MNAVSEMIHDLCLLPCLSGLNEESLSIMAQLARIREVGKNDIIFEESGLVEYYFILKRGTVKLHKTSPRGRELIVKVMGPGDYFCCEPLYAGGRYLVGAVALEDSTLIVIPSEDFKETLGKAVGESAWKVILGLCSRIRYLSSLVEDLTFKDVEGRIILTLARLAEERSPEDGLVSLALTHQDIALMTGTVREVVSRIMSRLKRDGVIVDSHVRGFKIDKNMLLSLLSKKLEDNGVPGEKMHSR